MSRRIHVAVFTSEASLLGALEECGRRGLEIVDVRSPYPIHGVDELAGIRPSRLPTICLVGGVAGLALALWFQYWSTSVDWPIDVGGKPWDSLPAFAPVAFEVTILLAGLAVVFSLLFRLLTRPRGGGPDLGSGVTNDRFAVSVVRTSADISDAALDELWRRAGAERTAQFVEEDR